LASASNDSTVQVWNLETGELAAVLEGHENTLHRGLAFSPDETLIATGSFDKTLRFWDAETGVERASIASGNDFIESLAFSPNGDIVATGTLLGQIRLWAVDLNAEPEEMVNAADANAEPVNTTGDESSEPEPATITMIDQGAIVVGQTVIGVTNSTQHRTLTFTATERQTITINNNSFSIFVEVLDADGNVIVERTDVARIGPITFDDGGDYTILLSTNSTGQFSIRITE
jgi:WD40 repeat protein